MSTATSTAEPARAGGMRLPFRIYALALAAGVLVMVPSAWADFRADPRPALFFLVLLAVASLLTVHILPDADVDGQLDAPVAIAAAVLLPSPLAVVTAFLGFTNLRELRWRAPPWLSLFNRAQNGLAVGLASVMAHLLQRTLDLSPMTELVIATSVAALVHYTANLGFFEVALRLLQRPGPPISPFSGFYVDFLFVSMLAVPFVVVYRTFTPVAVLLLAFPMGLGYSAIRSARQSEDRAEELTLQVRELETLNALGKRLLAEGDLQQVVGITRRALQRALGTTHVVVDLGGDVPSDLQAFKVPGAEPAAVGVPPGLSEGSIAAVEAVAGLLGMSLQRVELAEELAEVQQARVALSGRILEEGTRERSRIALEIHDDVLPYLAAAEIQADNVRTSLKREEAERAEELAAVTQDAIHGGIGRLREVLAQLRSQIIVPGSLREGLRESLEELHLVHGVQGRLVAPDELEPLPLALEILVLETVRGCLANVARHARATHVTVTLQFTHSGISATICDDGRGFDPSAIPEGSHGLSLMRQRVDLARGRFEVSSSVGTGTRVHVEVPL